MNEMTIPKRYTLTGQAVARRVPGVLAGRGLDPAFTRWVLTAHAGRVWLFGVLDPRKLERMERYTDAALLHHLSTVCDGVPVFLSNSSGLRYGFLLSRRPTLPRRADFPGCARGLVRLGVGAAGQPVSVRWNSLGHLLMAGMTRSGKSNFLRLLAFQGLREGAALLVADLDGATFPMLEGSPALLSPLAGTPDTTHTLVQRALAECDRRALLYRTADGFPETLDEYNAQVARRSPAARTGRDPLPRVLVVLDEFNATAVALGGARSKFAGDVASLCWRGLKFGVHVIVAAQDFDKRIVGRMRDQVNAVCFRVKSKELARAVGCAGAHRIPTGLPGRAITEQWGPVQTYLLDKSLLAGGDPAPVLSERECALVAWAVEENGGYLGLDDIQAHGLGQGAARRLAKEWEMKGWLVKDRNASNKRKIAGDLEALAYKLQTLQPFVPAYKPPYKPRQTSPGRVSGETGDREHHLPPQPGRPGPGDPGARSPPAVPGSAGLVHRR